MKKETLIAVFFGVLLGLGAAVAITMNVRKSEIKKINPIVTNLPVTPTVKVEQSHAETLEVASPQSGEIVQTKSITISGKAPKDGLIVIQSPASSDIRKSAGGNFSLNYPLAAGENVILISFYPKDQAGVPIEKELKVFSLSEQ